MVQTSMQNVILTFFQLELDFSYSFSKKVTMCAFNFWRSLIKFAHKNVAIRSEMTRASTIQVPWLRFNCRVGIGAKGKIAARKIAIKLLGCGAKDLRVSRVKQLLIECKICSFQVAAICERPADFSLFRFILINSYS